ncbi:four helix bundle protein [Bacteroides sp. OttesenSCG-928-J23]|nr:four helix bundle protein [Bacteroides sp. OttesenSCG-928-J23]
MSKHKNLIVWQKSMALVKEIYSYTSTFPNNELFGLTNQMRRCSVSIPSNIAEGFGRGSDKELVQFLFVSRGSSSELDTQLIIAHQLQFIADNDYLRLSFLNDEINKMLSSLIYRYSNGMNTVKSDSLKSSKA